MDLAIRSVYSKRWQWLNFTWKGEISMVYARNLGLHYDVQGFNGIYDGWILKVKNLAYKLNDSFEEHEFVESSIRAIELEFDHYKEELSSYYNSLNTEQEERLRRIGINLTKQYELVYKYIDHSPEHVDQVLFFLKEIPGRLKYSLFTIATEKELKIEEQRRDDFTNKTSKFLEGKIYVETEETGNSRSFFVKLMKKYR